MKIGRFAKNNELTIDTIRHYMDMDLIIPEKQGGQYDFDERCQSDLDYILSFKQMGFTLNEIKSIFMFKRLAKLTSYEENNCFKSLFINKHLELENQINELQIMKQKLQSKIADLSNSKNPTRHTMGIDLKMLQLISCEKCGKDMQLSKADIIDNQIISGRLVCNCGEEYIIEDGILQSNSSRVNSTKEFDINYIADYINTTNINYLDKLCYGIEWMHKKLDFSIFKGKTILELGSGIGFFLRAIYNDLPEDCTYIAVDYDINRHRFLKSVLETSDCKRNMMFVCTDFSSIPIKENSIDIITDISGTSNYGFEHSEFLLDLIQKYVKSTSYLLSSYILFKNFTTNSLIAPKYRENFLLSNVKSHISKLGYSPIDENISDYSEEGGKYENYFKSGEKVYSYYNISKR